MQKKKGTDLAHPLVKPRLTVDQLEMLLAHALRLPDVFTLARASLRPELFHEGTEKQYRLLWQTVSDIATRETPAKLFEQIEHVHALLELELLYRLQTEPEALPDEFYMKLLSRDVGAPGLLTWIYQCVDIKELAFSWGRDLLRDFRLEREVHDVLRRSVANAGNSVVMDMPQLLSSLSERHASISAINVNPVESGVPLGWFPKPMNKFPTGVVYLDPFLKGGHAGQEVYGVLGGFGSGKTSMAVSIAVKGALYQQELEEEALMQGDNYRPKDWYVFSYEATRDELRVRMLAQECSIDHTRLEDVSYENFTSSKISGLDGLLDYEKEYWANQLKSNPGMEILGEKERFDEMRPFLNRNLWLIDMNDSSNPALGTGYVNEIATIVEMDLRQRSDADGFRHEVGGIVIDYAGLCARRHLEAHGMGYDALRHLIGSMGDKCKKLLAVPYDCPVWLFHQLSSAANTRTYATRQHGTDAAEAKNFPENVSFCFELGCRDQEFGAFFMTCSKGRRAAVGRSPLLVMEGDFFRIVPAEHLQIGSDGKIWPKHDFKLASGKQTSSQTHHDPIDMD